MKSLVFSFFLFFSVQSFALDFVKVEVIQDFDIEGGPWSIGQGHRVYPMTEDAEDYIAKNLIAGPISRGNTYICEVKAVTPKYGETKVYAIRDCNLKQRN